MSEKYFRTYHLPWSPGCTSDDKKLGSAAHFLNRPLVITEKMDGSNLCMTRHAVFARSHNGPPTHRSFDYAKKIHGEVRNAIPNEISVFGEYVYALHSIPYTDLPGYFLVFGVREDATGKWWSWEMVEEMARDLGLPTVPVLHQSYPFVAGDGKTYMGGLFETAGQLEAESKLEYLFRNGGEWNNNLSEGYVVRVAEEFTDPNISIAKYVRANHVQSDEHWLNKPIIPNKLK